MNSNFNNFKNIVAIPNFEETFKLQLKNTYSLIENLQKQVTNQISQLVPQFNNERHKRGLIDGLGSIIKTITGNLDQNDAYRYDNAISKLSKNDQKIKSLINEQITLVKSTIRNFDNQINNVSANQKILNSRISRLEKLIVETKRNETNHYKYFLTYITLNQVLTEIQIIYNILEKLETAITFSKLNTFHNSIINPNLLLKEIKSINKHLKLNKLPLKPEIDNIILYEKIITVKSYSKRNIIVFILELPIIDKNVYNYYHMYSLPVFNQNKFEIIIPNNKYVIINNEYYATFNQPCKIIQNQEYLCEISNLNQLKSFNLPCEIQLLQYSKNVSNCLKTPVDFGDLKIQKVENNKYIIVLNHAKIVIKNCKGSTDKFLLNGTNLIELNNECSLQIDGTLIQNFENDLRNEFIEITLPKLNFINISNDEIKGIKPIKLNSINLDETKNVLQRLETERKNLNQIEPIVHFHTISFWTILTYIIIAILILIFAFRIFRKYKHKIIPERNNVEISVPEISL